MTHEKALLERLDRLAAALERIAPPRRRHPISRAPKLRVAGRARGVPARAHVNRQPLGLLKGIDRAAEQLLDNTRRFAAGCRPTTPCCGARAAWASRPW